MYDSFFKVDNLEVDSSTKNRLKETEILFKQLHEVEEALVHRIKSLSIQEKAVTEAETKLKEIQSKTENLTKQADTAIQSSKEHSEILNDLSKQIIIKKEELDKYLLTEEDVLQMELKKQDLFNFLQKHNLSEWEKTDLVATISKLRQTVSELEDKKHILMREIIEKETASRRLDRDLEQPKKILEEAKMLKLCAESEYKAMQEEREREPVGTAGSYMRKIKKAYPELDLNNVV